MSNAFGDNTQFTIRIHVASLDPHQVSTMALKVATQRIDDELQRAGYQTREVYAGTKGGGTLEVITQVSQKLYENKDIIIALAGVVAPIISHLLKKREGKHSSQNLPPKIIFMVSDVQKSIEVNESFSEQELLRELLILEPDISKHNLNDLPVTIGIVLPPESAT